MKKYYIIIVFLFLPIICIFTLFYQEHLATYNLSILESTTPLVYSSNYWDMVAVVSSEGNCYIRGDDVTMDTPYGVSDIKQYRNQYHSFNFDKANQFVKIYSGGDAVSIELSNSGGTILTSEQEVFLFSDDAQYRTPSLFCDNASLAKHLGDKVFILSPNGDFGYRTVANPSEFIIIKNNIITFDICYIDNSIWLLTQNNTLMACKDLTQFNNPFLTIESVITFDVLCTENANKFTPKYTLGIIKKDGKTLYCSGYGIPKESALKEVAIQGINIYSYSDGVIVLDKHNSAFLYGKDLYCDTFFEGENLQNNVAHISADMLNFSMITESGDLIFVGTLPSSKDVTLTDLMKK